VSETKTIGDRVKKVLAEQFAVNGNVAIATKDDESLHHDLGFDSLDIVEITMGVEDEFGIEIDDERMASFTTPQSIIDYVTANVKA
jgi:acyl carrier protein